MHCLTSQQEAEIWHGLNAEILLALLVDVTGLVQVYTVYKCSRAVVVLKPGNLPQT